MHTINKGNKLYMNKYILLYAIFSTLTGCSVNKKSNDITYVFDNESYTLTEECISELRDIDNTTNNSHIVYMKLKNTANCAGKLNSLFEKNIGQYVTTYFNKKIISKTYIASKINSAAGYHMVMPSRIVSNDIILYYHHDVKGELN